MANNLVIVESPAKAKTIEKFLGADFQVESSFGHIADLPPNGLGIDVGDTFLPTYLVSDDKKSVVSKLKTLAKKADTVWLASDEDREGEAIAWHLKEQLGLKEDKIKRIVFHEITKSAILKAVEQPRNINHNLVNAQQARRVLDRIVGYELSPVLWKKVKAGLSAGRVQSVAVRLIVERERAILAFNSIATYKVSAVFITQEERQFTANLSTSFENKSEAEAFLKNCIGADFSIDDLTTKPAKKSPAAPFTTSTLQQEAARKLGFSVSKTMTVAQRLYESGIITYMRTDSVNLSEEAKAAAAREISNFYGKNYSKVRNYTTKAKGAQEAHEAIRPTDMAKHHIDVEYDQNRLYDLIWKRTIASQMSDAELERTNVRIQNNHNDKIFTANGEMIKFDGFLKVYLEGNDNEDEEQEGMLPFMKVGEFLTSDKIIATERYSKPPYRYTEASLVKQLEDLGIGRPSTYAPTISTVLRRGYVEKGTVEGVPQEYQQLTLQAAQITNKVLVEKVGSDKGKLVPTDIGNIVNDFLVNHFENILDYGFTAKVEAHFDEIAVGQEDWIGMIKDFYLSFHKEVFDVSENAERESGERILGKHPESGKTVLVRLGRFGALAQIGEGDDEDKQFASLSKEQNLQTITLEEALNLFLLPKLLGNYKDEEVIVSNGRFGPYVKFGNTFVSLPKNQDPMNVDFEMAVKLIEEKLQADAPIAMYDELPVQKGVGRFGPFIKWNNIFINVNKKYDFDNLSQDDIVSLIETKKQAELDKIVQHWEEEGIMIEKARWGRHHIIQGKVKIELAKTVEVANLSLEQVKSLISEKAPKKKVFKTTAKKTVKTTKKK